MICHPERSEGPMDSSVAGKMHRFFASLRMTRVLLTIVVSWG
jgi:hypothetical protein